MLSSSSDAVNSSTATTNVSLIATSAIAAASGSQSNIAIAASPSLTTGHTAAETTATQPQQTQVPGASVSVFPTATLASASTVPDTTTKGNRKYQSVLRNNKNIYVQYMINTSVSKLFTVQKASLTQCLEALALHSEDPGSIPALTTK